jgi:hypothetical protein
VLRQTIRSLVRARVTRCSGQLRPARREAPLSVIWQTMAFSMGGPMVFDPGCMMRSRIETVLKPGTMDGVSPSDGRTTTPGHGVVSFVARGLRSFTTAAEAAANPRATAGPIYFLGSPTFTLPECAYPERESGWFPRPFASCRWNLGNDLPAPGVVYVRGFARQPPIPRQGTLVTSSMEVRSALGPAITRAGGTKSNGRRPIMKIPFRVLVWPNPLIEAIKSSRAVHLGQLPPRS